MASRILLESSSTDGYALESGSGVILDEVDTNTGARLFFSSPETFLWGAHKPALTAADWTIGLWVYWKGDNFTAPLMIGTDTGSDAIFLTTSFNGSASIWSVFARGCGSFDSTTTFPTNGSWRYMAIRYTHATTKLELITHGVLDATSATGTFTPITTARTIIGGRATGTGSPATILTQNWNGRVSNYHVWTRAVPTSELLDMATNLRVPEQYPTNLLLHFKLPATASPEVDTYSADTLTVSAAEGHTGPNLGILRTIAADPGSYAWTGIDANLLYKYKVIASGGSVSIGGGLSTALRYARLHTFDSGSVAINGTTALLKYARKFPVDAGSYLVTGTDASLIYRRGILASSGTYTITGIDASLLYARRVQATFGSYLITGTDVSLEYNHYLSAGVGSYVITGTDADLIYTPVIITDRTLIADPGAYDVTGTNAGLLYKRYLAAAAGSYIVTGTDASLLAARKLTASPGSEIITGTNASLLAGRVLVLASGLYVITGVDANFIYFHRLKVDSGEFFISGTPAALTQIPVGGLVQASSFGLLGVG